ncbi:unnamed protein product, partial [marine sediment metagenome]
SDSARLLKLYTAYAYILFYIMELDKASCVEESTGGGSTGSGEPPSPDSTPEGSCADNTEYVQTLFNYAKMKLCFINLGLDFEEIYDSLYTPYMENTLGICTKGDPDPPITEIATITNLTYLNYEHYVEIGEDVIPSLFQWEITGTPENLILTDDVGQITDVAVTGTGYNSGAETYNLADKGSVRWNLRGDNVITIYLTTQWIEPAYYGKNSTGIYPTSGQITSTGTKIISGNLKNEVLFTPDTAITEYGWVAVPIAEAT